MPGAEEKQEVSHRQCNFWSTSLKKEQENNQGLPVLRQPAWGDPVLVGGPGELLLVLCRPGPPGRGVEGVGRVRRRHWRSLAMLVRVQVLLVVSEPVVGRVDRYVYNLTKCGDYRHQVKY